MNSLPDNNLNVNIKSYVLDPLTVIIKLAILGNKPVGTKLLICNNTIYFQDPGLMQTIYRIYYKSNKTDLQYLYNPIHIACQHYLSSTFINKNPRIVNLFECAKRGIEKLSETYNHCAIITLCFNYYYTIIKNHLDKSMENTENLFQKDRMTSLYSSELMDMLNISWSDEKIKIILDLICFLNSDNMANENVKSLENIIENIDKENYNLINKNF